MARIAIDARESGTSTGRYVDKLIEYLSTLEPPHEFVVLTKKARIEYIKNIAPDFEVLESNVPEFSLAEQFELKRQIKKLRPDLVHFAMTQQPVFYRGRTITTVHDLITARFSNPSKNWLVFRVKQLIYIWVIKKVARKSIKIITPSNYVKNDLAKFAKIKPSKIGVTYEAGESITEVPKAIKNLIGKEFIMYLGRPQLHKNLRRLIDAFAILQKTRPDLYLVLAGKKDVLYARHERYVERKGLKNVYFTGFVSEGQLRWLYENTAAYIFPSLSEGFGLPALEAMAHGAPVVSSNATCLPEIYEDAAIYFDPLDVSDMAERINSILSDPKLHSQLIKMGREQASKYSWQRMAEQTLKIYKDALK